MLRFSIVFRTAIGKNSEKRYFLFLEELQNPVIEYFCRSYGMLGFDFTKGFSFFLLAFHGYYLGFGKDNAILGNTGFQSF